VKMDAVILCLQFRGTPRGRVARQVFHQLHPFIEMRRARTLRPSGMIPA
jgi:hypothetical protein